MKLIPNLLIILFFGLILIYSCKEESITNPIDEDNPIYFPDNEGTFYKFEILQSDSNGIVSTGTRNVYYLGDTLIDGISFRMQVDTIQIDQQFSNSSSYFRTTETGVFYFVDTTGFVSALPDSLQSSVEIQSEMRALLFPLADGTFWTVYRVSISLNEFVNFNLIDITGSFLSDEILTLNLSEGDTTVSVKKVEILLRLQTGLADSVITFDGFSWLAEDIGIVKMEGSAVVLNLFSGGEIDLSDTSLTTIQNLIEYKVN
jgi:hypothetical protein